MAKVVVFVALELNARNRKRMGVDFVEEEGHDLTVFDLSDIIHPDISRDRSDYPELRKRYPLHVVTEPGQLKDFLPLVEQADLVLNLAESGLVTVRLYPLFRLFARARTPYLVQSVNAFPGGKETPSLASRLLQKVRRPFNGAMAETILTRIPPHWLGIPAPRFQICGGRESEAYGRLCGPETQKIHAHAMDYEMFRDTREAELPATDTAVFIDEYLPFHPDITMMGIDPPMEANAYYRCLRNLFDRVEMELGLEVVVAACPMADYERHPGVFGAGIFGDRRVVESSTAKLVAQSKLVLAHRSTAINFAILFRKPLIILATRETYRHSSQTTYFDGFSQALGKDIQYFNDAAEVDLSDPFVVDDETNRRYINSFIKITTSPDLPLWRIVFDEIYRTGLIRH